jgi:hydrophobic/amphiphilic exporter-1 (mainly G- bacteria), HAE1 family
MNISAWSIRNPIPPIVLFVVLMVMGLLAFRNLDINSTPNIDLPTVTVTVV